VLVANVDDPSWGRDWKNRQYGLGFELDLKDRLGNYGVFGHEGAGRSGLMIDPEEQFVAAWFSVCGAEWIPEVVENVQNLIWSGIV